jgi:hypothetical protein
MPKVYTVEEILSLWFHTFYYYNLPLEKEKLFIKVEYQNEGNYFDVGNVIDWWPRYEFEERCRLIKEEGRDAPQYWNVYKGTISTAEHLFKAESKREMQLILLAAFLRDTLMDVPKTWYGKNYELLYQLQKTLHPEIQNYYWHFSSKYALPVSLTKDYVFLKEYTPKNIEGLIMIAALNAVLSISAWQLVNVVGIDPI